jgi:hypothetical protein
MSMDTINISRIGLGILQHAFEREKPAAAHDGGLYALIVLPSIESAVRFDDVGSELVQCVLLLPRWSRAPFA